MAMKRRVVVVGLGSIGKRHARLLLERDDTQVEICEPDPHTRAETCAALGSLGSHEDFETMLDSRPDVVWLASPTHLHAEQSVAALRTGAHVFCEKPMTYGVAEARPVLAAARASDKIFNVGFYLRFAASFGALKQLVESGELGSVLHVRAHVGTYVTLVNSVSRYQSRQQGSLFFDYSHQPDLFFWILGKAPSSVHVYGRQAGDLELTSDPNIVDMICEYDAPLTAHIHLNYVQMPQRHEYEIIGDRGWARLDFERGTITIGYRFAQTITTKDYQQERDDIFRAEHRAFFDALDGKRAPAIPAEEGIVSTAVCDAALRSYLTKQKVAVIYQ